MQDECDNLDENTVDAEIDLDDSQLVAVSDDVPETPDAESVQEEQSVPEDVEVIGARFKRTGKIYYFDPNGVKYPVGTDVLVKTARGVEYAEIACTNTVVPGTRIVLPLRPVVRAATQQDRERHIANVESEKEAFRIFNDKIAEHKLEMKLVDVEYTFDNNRLTFYFTAEGRVDFRDLVKDLASVFKTRIELRQIGIRDETKLIGGLGVCGRPYCCCSFLPEFSQVSIKMAKEQNLSLNSAKISGGCGKLMCCLRYEHEVYEEENRNAPKQGSVVQTPDGEGTVVECSPIAGTVKVQLFSEIEKGPRTFKTAKIIRTDKTPEQALEDFKAAELKKAEESLMRPSVFAKKEAPEKEKNPDASEQHKKNSRGRRGGHRRRQPHGDHGPKE